MQSHLQSPGFEKKKHKQKREFKILEKHPIHYHRKLQQKIAKSGNREKKSLEIKITKKLHQRQLLMSTHRKVRPDEAINPSNYMRTCVDDDS